MAKTAKRVCTICNRGLAWGETSWPYCTSCKGDDVSGDDTPDDGVAAPSHYVEGRKYEPHLVIEDWGLNHNAGSVMKYIARYLLKGNPIKDLRKARRYLDFEIERLESQE